ncbi:MAG TPA: hypothetical protein VFU63_03250 [Ktedonobacterales bacterium]|nr:hypothetical protein [Ktedonobacterales bacterium]
MWPWQQWLKVGGLVIAASAVIVGLRFIAIPAFVSTPDTVRVVVTEVQPPSRQGKVIFDQQSSRQAGAVYQQLVSGGPLTTGSSCPSYTDSQPYYHYELTFFHNGVKVATATSDAIGCQTFAVDYLGGTAQYFSWMDRAHTSFWVRLHQLMGAPIPIGICRTMPLCSAGG